MNVTKTKQYRHRNVCEMCGSTHVHNHIHTHKHAHKHKHAHTRKEKKGWKTDLCNLLIIEAVPLTICERSARMGKRTLHNYQTNHPILMPHFQHTMGISDNFFSPSTAFVTLHKPSSVQLSHTQTNALETNMHYGMEKSFLKWKQLNSFSRIQRVIAFSSSTVRGRFNCRILSKYCIFPTTNAYLVQLCVPVGTTNSETVPSNASVCLAVP